jgi:TRAP-type mannitol/chloroaromatic compound transport system permease small subunit
MEDKNTANTAKSILAYGLLTLLPELHMLPYFVYMIYRCYTTVLQFHLGVTSSVNGGFIPLLWAYILVFACMF